MELPDGGIARLSRRISDVGLQRRVMAYAFIGLTSLAAIYAWVALDAVGKSSEAILRERLNLVTTVAQSIDQTIISSQSLVRRTANDLTSSHSDLGELTEHQIAMLESLEESLADVNSGALPQRLFLIGSAGQLLWDYRGDGFSEGPALAADRLPRETSPSTLTGEQGEFAITVGSDVEGNPELAYLGAVILPSAGLLTLSDQTDAQFGEYRMELLDSRGRVIADSSDQQSLSRTRHMEVIGELVINRDEGVGNHSPSNDDDSEADHIVAYAPLTSVSWGVVLEQKEDAALALPNSLRRRVLIIASVGLALGLAMAWITSRQVVAPLSRLTERAMRIAEGDLSGNIPAAGQDEILRLARSFETMRDRLETSQRELGEWSSVLEQRVRERTDQLEQRDRERDELLSKVITAQEEERTRIARDLHDQIGQTLTGLVMQIGGIEARLGSDPEEAKEQLTTLGESTSGAVEEVRRMMSDLRPSILDDMGLESAIGWYTDTHLGRVGIDVDLDFHPNSVPLSPNVEISAFRVFQEAITNVVKHADAKHVKISVTYENGRMMGMIEDDGAGFELSEAQPGADGGWAVGLLGMTERVNLLGGSLDINSSPGSGTKVNFEIPLGGET